MTTSQLPATRVLIVEDDEGIAAGLAAMLKAEGYAVDMVTTLGQAAAQQNKGQ